MPNIVKNSILENHLLQEEMVTIRMSKVEIQNKIEKGHQQTNELQDTIKQVKSLLKKT